MADAVLDIPDLPAQLRQLMAHVPAGKVTTCGELARTLGNPIAARWVGHFLLHHVHDTECPCHRVVRAEGVLGPYIAGGEAAKARQLRAEGVEVCQGIVDLSRYGIADFVSDHPLEAVLRRVQGRILSKVRIVPRRQMPGLVGGVDVSYANGEEGIAAYALVAVASGELVWSATVRRRVVFPYITSYLTFRELPILMELLGEVRAAGTGAVLLVDGSGILHHRHAGIATHLGVVAGLPTIGVTKRLLCGQANIEGMRPLEARPVLHEDRPIGVALRPTAGSRRPIFRLAGPSG